MLGNEALVPYAEAAMLGNERSTGAVLEAKMEITKKYFVSTAGHSKLQVIAFEKMSSIFSVLFSDDMFLPKRAVAGGNPYYFSVRNSVFISCVPFPPFSSLVLKNNHSSLCIENRRFTINRSNFISYFGGHP